MPIAKIQLPDGRIARFEVAEGTTPEQVTEFASKQFMVKQPVKPVTQADLITQEVEQTPAWRNALIGMGKGMGDVGIGAEQAAAALRDKLGGFAAAIPVFGPSLFAAGKSARPSADIQADIDARKAISAPLLKTKAGLAGNVAGSVAAAAPAMFIPGANTALGATLIGAGTGALAPVASDESRMLNTALGGVGGLAGQQLGKAVGVMAPKIADKMQAARKAMQSADSVKNATMQMGRDAGYVVTPSAADAGTLPKLAEGLSGLAKTKQAAAIKNQAVTDKLARIALGVPEDMPITGDVLRGLRQQAFQEGYEPVRQAGQIATDAEYGKALNEIAAQFKGASRSFPGTSDAGVGDLVETLKVPAFDAGDAVDQVKILRDTADAAFRQGNNQLAHASKQAAKALEDQLERGLSGMGDNGAQVLQNFRNARQSIAKTFSVEKALNDATGQVDAGKLAQQFARGKPLSGELKQIGQFANAFKELTKVPQTGNANPLTVLDYATGGFGLGTANPALVALPAARVGARKAILSGPVQKAITSPNYGAGLLESFGRSLENNPGMTRGLLQLMGQELPLSQ